METLALLLEPSFLTCFCCLLLQYYYFHRERLNEELGLLKFGIDARFQNPAMPIPTYPGTHPLLRAHYLQVQRWLCGSRATGLGNTMARNISDLELVLQNSSSTWETVFCFHPRSIFLINSTQSENLVSFLDYIGYARTSFG